MHRIYILHIVLLFSFSLFAQPKTEEIKINDWVSGELTIPSTSEPHDLVIIIAGSGPTDRDGNIAGSKNNSLKYLSDELVKNNIATFRFDKRTLTIFKQPGFKEENIRFEDFVQDVEQIVALFNNDSRFDKIILAGHSKGSLLAMLAINKGAAVDAMISIAGAGQSIDQLIIKQISAQQPFFQEPVTQAFEQLKTQGFVTDYHPMLESIFRKSVQPFMLSWMQYDPQVEIASVTVPVIILNGTEDIQTDESEARRLHQAKSDALFFLIENMNHVLKEVIPGDTMDNGRAYSEPNRPVVPELIEKIVYFIEDLD